MITFPDPKLEIGGVPMQAQNFTWVLTPGVLPYTSSILVPIAESNIHAQLLAIPNPTYIKLTAYGGTEARADRTELLFENIYLMEPKQIDPFHVRWSFADSRWAWRGKKLWYSYNKTRKLNLITSSVPVGELTPAILRQPFDTFGAGRYVYWSLKDQETPWNMKQILEDQLTQQGIPFDPAMSNDDGAYILENIEADGVDIYQGLANLLAASRLNIGIKRSGEVYVYSLDYFDDSQVNLIVQWQTYAKTAPGTLYMEDKSRIRPKKVHVYFDVKQEIRVVKSTSQNITSSPNFRLAVGSNSPLWDSADFEFMNVVGCQNMIQCPYPVYSAFSAREFRIGEWLPMWEYLASLNPPITEAQIQQWYFNQCLERHYCQLLDAGNPFYENESFVQNIVGAIKRHYRRTYQIDPWCLDRIKSWEARRVAVIDNYSHYSSPSPLFADYCVIPTSRHPMLAKRIAAWDTNAYNWRVNDRDPYRRQPTAGTINMIDQALGIFGVSYPSSPDLTVKLIIPSAISDATLPKPQLLSRTLDIATLDEEHTLETIISVVWNTDRTGDYRHPRKFYLMSIPYHGLGPEVEYYSTLEHARFPVRECDAEGSVTTNPDICINGAIVDAIANSEAARIMNQFKDRYSGFVTLAGAVNVSLTGSMKGIAYSFNESSGLTTSLDFRDRPPDPTLEQIVSPKTLAYLKRQVPRGDEVNNVGG